MPNAKYCKFPRGPKYGILAIMERRDEPRDLGNPSWTWTHRPGASTKKSRESLILPYIPKSQIITTSSLLGGGGLIQALPMELYGHSATHPSGLTKWEPPKAIPRKALYVPQYAQCEGAVPPHSFLGSQSWNLQKSGPGKPYMRPNPKCKRLHHSPYLL